MSLAVGDLREFAPMGQVWSIAPELAKDCPEVTTRSKTLVRPRAELIALVQVFCCPLPEAFEGRLADRLASGRVRMGLARAV